MRDYMKEYYEGCGCHVDYSVSNIEYDVLLTYRYKKTSIEEKYRRKEFPDILVELIQDIATNNSGWYYTSNAEYLNYIICDERPLYFYKINYRMFKDFVIEYIRNNTAGFIIAKEGYGLTLNISIPLSDIPVNIIETIHIPHGTTRQRIPV